MLLFPPFLACRRWLTAPYLAVVFPGIQDKLNHRGLRCLLPALVAMLLPASARLDAQTQLWGLTSGGAMGFGSIINLNTDGSGFANFAFENPGVNPIADLLESGGKFYGMTPSGGNSGYGVLFEYDPAGGGAGSYTVKHHFDGTNGGNPLGSLIASGGKFYGMTSEGGSNGYGVLFEYDPAGGGTYTIKHHFDGISGSTPYRSLIASGGKFYGMTSEGGSKGYGALFEYDPAGGGIYTVMHHFNGANGGNPLGSLIASGGKFYGMTSEGGRNGYGVLFEYDPAGGGTYTIKHHFDFTNGGNPYGSLIASGGKFYGMTASGGSDSGVLFEYDPDGAGAYAVKHHFDYTNGGNPYGSLIASDSKFYGMTFYGGGSDNGVLFEYDPTGSGTYTIKHTFDSPLSGGPYGSLIASDGKFYGMASSGGSSGGGVIFEYDPAGSGTYTVKYHFDFTKGGIPYGNLVASGGKFYGMASSGGASAGGGVLFEYNPAAGAGTYTVKHHFDHTNGSFPHASLVASGGKFYGMTFGGGSGKAGVLFEYDPAGSGTFTVKHHFDLTTGRTPFGNLIASGGKFYGMTYGGGSKGAGVLFEYDPAGTGTYTVKHHFNNTEGSYPRGSLIESGGKFYGMTSEGGSAGYGVLFQYDLAGGGAYKVMHHFDNTRGSRPNRSLIALGGKFYGMTGYGGSSDVGVLFEYDPAGGGTYTVRHHFDGANGANPLGSLIASGGKFYGMTYGGGSSDGGVIFEYDPAGTGTYKVLRHLEYANGIHPFGDLIAITMVNTTNLAEGPALEMQVSPNPSGDQVTIKIFSEKALPGNLAIYDLQGRPIAVLAKDRIFQGQERIVWPTVGLPVGVFFLRLQTEAGVYVEKFIKQ